ncbi:carbohydrate ABC transporter substrate-binding protein [Candidatus Aerophobetes bacterium]|nr:carbohydrate ABC transporter substrate-binding protein [Candidatus Aerophobetes bacterium]
MKRKDRLMFVVGMVSLVIILMIICSINAGASSREKKLVIYSSDTEIDKWISPIIKKFNSKYPNVKVEYMWYKLANMEVAFKTAYAAGEQVDMLCADMHPLWYFYKFGALRKDLIDLLGGKDYLKRFIPTVVEASTALDGTVVGVPIHSSAAFTIFYNTKIFNELGLSAPRTFDELYSISDKIKQSGISPMVFPGGDRWWWTCIPMLMIPYRTNNKGKEFVVNTMKGIIRYDNPTWIQIMKDSLEFGKIMMPGWTSLSLDAACMAFAKGKAAMYYHHPISIGTIARYAPKGFDFDVILGPVRDNLKPQHVGGTYNWVITSTAKDPKLCAEFIKVATTNEALYYRHTHMVRTYLPAVEALWNTPWFSNPKTNPLAPYLQKCKKLMPYTVRFYNHYWESEIEEAMTAALEKAFTEEGTAEEICAAVQAAHEKLVREGKTWFPQAKK